MAGDRAPRERFLAGFFLSLLLIGCVRAEVRAQQQLPPVDDTARGIKLYHEGDTIGAIEALRTAVKRRKDDAEAWLYLGLAYIRGGHAERARAALEKAVRLNPQSADAHTSWAYALLLANKLPDAAREAEYALALNPQSAEAHYFLGAVRLRERERSNALKEAEAALKLKPELLPALLLKAEALIGVFIAESIFTRNPDPALEDIVARWRWLKEAADALETYINLNPSKEEGDSWRRQLAALRVYGEDHRAKPDAQRQFFFPTEVTQRARILQKVEPRYTTRARQNGVMGTVILLAVLAVDGSVKNILTLQGLPDGLTEEAILAAQQMKFEPAIKEGRQVSMAVQIEYNFNLY